MSDIEKLVEKFERGELLRPDPDVLNVVDLARALGWIAGIRRQAPTPGSAKIVEIVGEPDHLIFVLADGLGLNLLWEQPESSFLARHTSAELRSIFPSTTAAVLTTLATGEWPNQHGVTGQWTHLPEIRGAAGLLQFAARSGGRSLTHLGVTVEQAFPLPALMTNMPRDVLALFPSALVNTVSTTYFSGSRPRLGYANLSGATDTILSRINSATAPTYTYLYSPKIDSESHYLGVKHFGVRSVVNELDREIERLAQGVEGRARIVVSADHGLLDTPVTAKHHFKPSADLFGTLQCGPSGDDRLLYFRLQDGAEDRFRERIKAHYGDRFLLITIEEAERYGLFGPGPISPVVRDRFGDLLLISAGVDVVEYVLTGQIGRRVDLNAYHSGLNPVEMRVPLIVV